MKHYLIIPFFGLLLFCLTGCEGTMSNADKTNLNYVQKLIKHYDKRIAKLMKEPSHENALSESYNLYNELKKNKSFLGMSVNAHGGSFCTLNAYDCSFDGERDAVFEDTKLQKSIWYGDLAYNVPQFNGDTLIAVNRAVAGTGSQNEFQGVIPDILVITYGDFPFETRLYFKAKAVLQEKQANGASSWGGTGMMDPVFLDR